MTALEEYGTAVLDGRILAGEKIKRQYEKLLTAMDCIITRVGEDKLRQYRTTLPHL